MLTHVDDFNLAGDDDLVEKVLEQIERELTVSKVKRDRFGFTGLDVAAVEDVIEVLMNDYMQGWKDIKEIQKAKRDEELLKLDMKEYRKITKKIS